MVLTSSTNTFIWNLIYLHFSSKPQFSRSPLYKNQFQRIPLSGSTHKALGTSQKTQTESSWWGRMSWKSSHAPKIESYILKELCHGMTEHLKLAGTSGDHLIQHSCSWKAQPEQMDQDCVQLDSGHLQGWRFHDFSKLFLSLPPLSPQRIHTLSFKAPGTASRGTFKEGIWEECWKESWNGLV